ncbi:expressed protein [Batrachochytrium dendrobatidis JAM81]|uniref:Expressed protein n=2 Tax=Batrachochytrium dendrobatidis TaxID=109871 RepID=F4PBI5_BATDJ|nr:uncharacterized protein BATDEDRAFT_37433 [Batrachochytrium dendrobatidis JAM81]EGF77330.1 expressed protein [Batrachochytrium dendrobatidis JAM81]|eukprot:XP_006682014.1 expressed protein [Batrachochytrium dendrobatidis JAM81]
MAAVGSTTASSAAATPAVSSNTTSSFLMGAISAAGSAVIGGAVAAGSAVSNAVNFGSEMDESPSTVVADEHGRTTYESNQTTDSSAAASAPRRSDGSTIYNVSRTGMDGVSSAVSATSGAIVGAGIASAAKTPKGKTSSTATKTVMTTTTTTVKKKKGDGTIAGETVVTTRKVLTGDNDVIQETVNVKKHSPDRTSDTLTPLGSKSIANPTVSDKPLLSKSTNLESLSSADTVGLPSKIDSQYVSFGHGESTSKSSILSTSPYTSDQHKANAKNSSLETSQVILSGADTRSTQNKNRDSSMWIRGERVTHVEHLYDEQDDDDDLNAYHAPAPTSHVVVANYFPRNSDEMHLQSGDLIGIEKLYKDGWARGQNLSQSRKRCMFPMAIVTPIISGPTQTVRKGKGNVWVGSSTTHGTTIEEQQQAFMDQNELEKAAHASALLKRIPDREDSLRRLNRNGQHRIGGGDIYGQEHSDSILNSRKEMLRVSWDQQGVSGQRVDDQYSLRSLSSDDSIKAGAVVDHRAS